MVGNTNYYVFRRNGKVRRIAKITSGCAFGYEHGRWIPIPGLIKIQHEITDFDEVSADEVKQMIEKGGR